MNSAVRLPGYRAGIHCRVTLTKGKGNKVTARVGPFTNLVVEFGLDSLAEETFDNLVTHCHVGSGTTEPELDDNALQSHIAVTDNVTDQTPGVKGSPPYFSEYIQTWRFVAGTFDDDTVTEVGFNDQNANTDLFSRALVSIPNRFRGPGTMFIQADEWLDVSYDFRLYPSFINADGSLNDGEGIIEVAGSEHEYRIRPSNVTTLDYWSAQNAIAKFVSVSNAYATPYGAASELGLVSNAPSSQSGAVAWSQSEINEYAYVAGNYYRAIILLIGPNDCNAAGGVGALRFHTGFGAYQMSFDPPVPKTSLISWRFIASLYWANVEF